MLEQSLDSFHTVAESANRLSLAAERLPEDTRDTVRTVSAEIEKQSATLKSLFAEYRGAITETKTTAGNVSSLVEALSRTSEQLNQAGVAWGQLVATLKAPPPPGQPASKPFDIVEYEKTAVAIRSTAEELRGLLGDVEKTREGVVTEIEQRLAPHRLEAVRPELVEPAASLVHRQTVRAAREARERLRLGKLVDPQRGRASFRRLTIDAAVLTASARIPSADCFTCCQDPSAAADTFPKMRATSRRLPFRAVSWARASLRRVCTRARASASIVRSALRKPFWISAIDFSRRFTPSWIWLRAALFSREIVALARRRLVLAIGAPN
jgi:hypothetical protein